MNIPILLLTVIAVLASGGLVPGEPRAARDGDALRTLLERVQSDDAEVRLAARREAPAVGAVAIAPLTDLVTDSRRDIAITARAAIEAIVHHAGRPGGAEERGEVCAALREELTPDQALEVKREFLWFLGLIGGDRSVPTVARLLSDPDPHVAETARLSLERMPGAASISALVAALEKAGDERKGDFLYSLAKKGEPAVVGTLAAHAAPDRPPIVRMAALEGLARMGAPGAISLLEAALEKPAGLSRERLFTEYLRLADTLSATVDRALAAPIYRRALAEAPHDHQREHALHGATKQDVAQNVDLVIDGLGSPGPRVRRLASRLLAGLEGERVLTALREAYSRSSPELRPVILLAMAGRDRSAVDGLVDDAAASTHPALRVAALSVLGRLGDPALAPVCTDLARDGPEALRPVAVGGLLEIAEGQLENGRREPALDLFESVLQLEAATDAQRSRSLRGVVRAGHGRALDIASTLLTDPVLAGEAAQGVIQLAVAAGKAGAKDRAEKSLRAVMEGRFPVPIRLAGMDGMREIGLDPQGHLTRQGFILQWRSTTPIIHGGPDDFATDHFPVERYLAGEDMGFDEDFRIGPRRVFWRELRPLSPDGMLDLQPLFRRTTNVLVYMYAETQMPEARDVLLKMGSDDGIACWLNGEPVHTNYALRGFKLDEDVVPARLVKGKNSVLLKVVQGDGGWAVSFRITDREGQPIDLRGKL